MKHILPIIGIVLSLAALILNTVCLILIALLAVDAKYVGFSVFAVPNLVIGLIMTAGGIFLNFGLMKHILCKIGFYVAIFSALEVVAAFIVMFAF